MWTPPPVWRAALAGSHQLDLTVTSVLAGRTLATISCDPAILASVPDAAPLDDWQISHRWRSGQVESTLTLTVTDRAAHLLTSAPDAPLQSYGQRLMVSATISSAEDRPTIPVGVYRIEAATTSGGAWHLYPTGRWVRPDQQVTVTAVDLLALVAEYDFMRAEAPPAGATRHSEIARLVDGALPVALTGSDPALSPTPWEGSRIDAVLDLMRDYDRVAAVDRTGVLRDLPASGSGATLRVTATTPDGSLDADGTALISWRPRASRDRTYNGVRATGESETGEQVSGVAYHTSGPLAWDPAGYGRVTLGYHSPQIRTSQAAHQAARTRLATALAARTQEITVECVCDLTVDVLDHAEIVIPDTGRRMRGIITSVEAQHREPMRLTVAVPADDVEI